MFLIRYGWNFNLLIERIQEQLYEKAVWVLEIHNFKTIFEGIVEKLSGSNFRKTFGKILGNLRKNSEKLKYLKEGS